MRLRFAPDRALTVAAPGDRLARLDGMRGLAACVVAFGYHAKHLFTDAQFAGGQYGPVVDWFQQWGWTFVDLFFVLSGYIFAHVYLRGHGLQSRAGLADFAVARVARLYPLHLLMLLVIALFAWGGVANTPLAFTEHLLMLQAFTMPFAESFDGPSWSLSVECFCYLAFAGAAASGKQALGWVTIGAIAWGTAMIAAHGQPGGPWVNDIFPRTFLGFFIGQALWHGRGGLRHVPVWVLAAVAGAGVLMPSGGWSPLLPLLLLAWPACLLLALRLPLFESRLMVWLGDRSYAIYLIHLPLIGVLTAMIGPMQGGPGLVLAGMALLTALTLIAAELSLRYVETPARRWIRAAWDSRRRLATVTAPV